MCTSCLRSLNSQFFWISLLKWKRFPGNPFRPKSCHCSIFNQAVKHIIEHMTLALMLARSNMSLVLIAGCYKKQQQNFMRLIKTIDRQWHPQQRSWVFSIQRWCKSKFQPGDVSFIMAKSGMVRAKTSELIKYAAVLVCIHYPPRLSFSQLELAISTVDISELAIPQWMKISFQSCGLAMAIAPYF
jgi:hypothetical protein